MKLLATIGEGSRLELEQRADASRDRLAAAVDALDARWRELRDVKLQLRRHAAGFVSAASGLFVGAGAVLAVMLYRHRQRDERLRQARMRAVGRLWQYPERVAVRKSLLLTSARMVLIAATAIVTTKLATHRIERARRRPRLPAHPIEPFGV